MKIKFYNITSICYEVIRVTLKRHEGSISKFFWMIYYTSCISIPYGNVGTLGLLLIWILIKLIKFLKMREKSWMMDLSATSVTAISFLLISSFFLLSLRAFLDRYLYHSTNNVDTKCLSPNLFLSLSLSLSLR